MGLFLGLMSGTSLDGIDAALVETDGRDEPRPLNFHSVPYDAGFRERLRAVLGGQGKVEAVEQELTYRHADAVTALLAAAGVEAREVQAVGFHGQTILHAPEARRTWQIGDGAQLAELTGVPVICDFRSADVAAGGQGAPLAPLYHAARAGSLPRPLAVLNLGGVGNVTWIGAGEEELVAFDTGPGNALLDDWARRHAGRPCDFDGALAAAGRVDQATLQELLRHPYFDAPPPKSLDRDAFDPAPADVLSAEDGAATLAAFTVEAVQRALMHLPDPPLRWLVTGGGRHNPVLMQQLAARLETAVQPVEAVGWNGDALEAEAFAYLAARSLVGLPLSLPGTTGVPRPMTGGRLFNPASRST